jgi:hypothetical protein
MKTRPKLCGLLYLALTKQKSAGPPLLAFFS